MGTTCKDARIRGTAAVRGAAVMDSGRVRKAVDALLDYKQKTEENSKKSNLLSGADPISVQIAFKRIPERPDKKPTLIQLPHSLYSDEEAKVCLIVKDPQRKVKDLLEGQPPSTNVDKVLGLSKLRKRYKQYDDKRQLCSQYDIFLADEAVTPMLPPLTGKPFYASKRIPIPIDMRTKKKLLDSITRAKNSTVFWSGAGACSALKVATTDFDTEQVTANVESAVEQVAEVTVKKWKNIKSIHIKTHDSLALPIYNSDNADESTKRAAADDSTPSNSSRRKRRKKSDKK